MSAWWGIRFALRCAAMSRASARMVAMAAVAMGGLLVPALGCTLIVQFEDAEGGADASVATTTHRDAAAKSDAGSVAHDASMSSPANDADQADDASGGDDDATEPQQDALPPAIFAKAPPGAMSGPPANMCDPCGGEVSTGWRCAGSIPSGCVLPPSYLIYCSGDAGPALGYVACGADCVHLGSVLIDICNPCSSSSSTGKACVAANDDPKNAAYEVVCTAEEVPDAAATTVCESADCGTGCSAP